MTSESVTWEVRSIVQGAIEARFPDRQHFRDEVILELMISQLTAYPDFLESIDASFAQRDEEAKKLADHISLWQWIEEVIDLADIALTRYPDDGQKIKRWDHPPPTRLDGPKDVDDSASLETLRDCAVLYNRADWARSPSLELWLVRKMIYSETFAFSSAVGIPLHYKSFKFWWMWTKSFAKWVIGLGVAVSIGEVHGLAVGVLTYVAWLGLTSYLVRDQIEGLRKLTETFASMRTAYAVSLRDPPCPVEIERHLSLAEDRSAVWPAGLRSLVERGISRNKKYWT